MDRIMAAETGRKGRSLRPGRPAATWLGIHLRIRRGACVVRRVLRRQRGSVPRRW
jgi:hypothetical protein